MPLAENLSLIFSEESLEETELRKSLGLFTAQDEIQRDVDTEMADSTNPPNPATSTALPKTIPTPAHPIRAASPKSNGNHLNQRKVVTPSEPTPAPVQETTEQPSSGSVRSTTIEPPKSQISKTAPQVPQGEASGHSDQAPRIPAYTMPGPIEADEDEEMPAIDLESDSDIE